MAGYGYKAVLALDGENRSYWTIALTRMFET